MTMEISTIESKALRKAAETADSQGNVDGELDTNEMSVFVKDAYRRGCSAEDITVITGVETEDATLAKTLEQMREIEEKKKELEIMQTKLDTKENFYKTGSKDSRKFNLIIESVTGVLGGGAGFGALVGIDRVIWPKGAGKPKFPKLDNLLFQGKFKGWGTVAAFVTAGIVGGIFAGKALAEKTDVFGLKPHKAKVSEQQSSEYKEAEINPLKEQIETLQKEIYAMENAFMYC